MRTNFDQKRYGQLWQVETVFSMIKRNQGETIYARTYWAQNREMLLKVLTHNIAVLLLIKELFYRATMSPLFPPNSKDHNSYGVLPMLSHAR